MKPINQTTQIAQPVGRSAILLGEQTRRLLKLIATKSAEEMRDQVEFINAWD